MESNSVEHTAGSTGNGHYKPPFGFAMGGVPLGNEFEFVTDKVLTPLSRRRGMPAFAITTRLRGTG
jgi:hypothetical protein